MNRLWRITFNPEFGTPGRHVDEICELARKTGYPLYQFNGTIYRTPPRSEPAQSQPIQGLAEILFGEE